MKYSIVTIAILAAFQQWTPFLEAAAPPAPDKTATATPNPKPAEKLEEPAKDGGTSTSTCNPGNPGCGGSPTVYYPAPSYYSSPSCDPNSHLGCGGAPVYSAPQYAYPPVGAPVCGVNGCGGGGIPSPVVGPYYASPYTQPQTYPQYPAPPQGVPVSPSSYPPPVAGYEAPPLQAPGFYGSLPGTGKSFTASYQIDGTTYSAPFNVDPGRGRVTFGDYAFNIDSAGRGTYNGQAVQFVLGGKGPKGEVDFKLVGSNGEVITSGKILDKRYDY